MSAAKLNLELLSMLIDQKAPTVRQLPTGARRDYGNQRVAEHRAKIRASKERGIVEPTKSNIRDALADAALSILATGGPGVDEVRQVLTSVFSAHPGTPKTVEVNARSQRLKPKLFKSS